jgi:hypothetical protein
MAEPQWMSIVEYARAFNVSDMTIRRRIKTGRLQAVLRDGKYYIPADGRAAAKSEPVEVPRPQVQPPTREFRPQPRHFEQASPAPQPRYEARPQPVPQTRGEYHRPQVEEREFRPRYEERNHEMQRMIDVCESAVRSLGSLEQKLEDNYRSKTQLLEAKLLTMQRENEQLNQKIQDLQLLVSILEKRRT